jgi:hypothetical protein
MKADFCPVWVPQTPHYQYLRLKNKMYDKLPASLTFNVIILWLVRVSGIRQPDSLPRDYHTTKPTTTMSTTNTMSTPTTEFQTSKAHGIADGNVHFTGGTNSAPRYVPDHELVYMHQGMSRVLALPKLKSDILLINVWI